MPDPRRKYFLRHLALGSQAKISLSKDQYEKILQARRTLDVTASFEEKFFCVSESYRQTEDFVLKSVLLDMVYHYSNVAEMHAVRAEFGRLTSAFLSLARLYLDSLLSDADSISGGVIQRHAMKEILTNEYDSSFYYRVMEAIRNVAQHRAFPVSGVRFERRREEDSSQLVFSCQFYLDASRLDQDEMFKKAVRDEIRVRGDKVYMKECVRSYFESLCNIHTKARKEFASYRSSAIATIQSWRESWKKEFQVENLSGVAACRMQGDLSDEIAYIDPQLDEYREWLEKRTVSLANMSKRRVEF